MRFLSLVITFIAALLFIPFIASLPVPGGKLATAVNRVTAANRLASGSHGHHDAASSHEDSPDASKVHETLENNGYSENMLSGLMGTDHSKMHKTLKDHGYSDSFVSGFSASHSGSQKGGRRRHTT
ncbi:hypothetical protein AX14_002490 [Amanita brunnescens Koide BX004]|nr:hypothetical protein AX14_002490 [Amanita brunnescens Koide BX004]